VQGFRLAAAEQREFAPQQRIVSSQTASGYAIVFAIGEIECAVLVSEPGHLIDGLTASEPRRESGRVSPAC